jgi:hypothetical protein
VIFPAGAMSCVLPAISVPRHKALDFLTFNLHLDNQCFQDTDFFCPSLTQLGFL